MDKKTVRNGDFSEKMAENSVKNADFDKKSVKNAEKSAKNAGFGAKIASKSPKNADFSEKTVKSAKKSMKNADFGESLPENAKKPTKTVKATPSRKNGGYYAKFVKKLRRSEQESGLVALNTPKEAKTRAATGEERRMSGREFGNIVFYVLALLAWAYVGMQLALVAVATIALWFFGAEAIAQSTELLMWCEIATYVAEVAVVIGAPILAWKLWGRYVSGATKPWLCPAEKRQALTSTGWGCDEAKTSRNLLGLSGLPKWADIGLAPIAFIIYMVLATALMTIFANFAWFDATAGQATGLPDYLFGWDLVIAFVVLVLVAPIVEEVLFRGWLYGKMRTRTGFLVAALIVSAFFGFLHGQLNVGVNVFALSFVLCALREITGTIYAGILLHILKNAVAFCLLYVCYWKLS